MSALQKWLLTLGTMFTLVSGAIYGIIKYFGEQLAVRFPTLFCVGDDPFSAVKHPLQPWALDLHVLSAPILVFAIGWIFKDHILAKLSVRGIPVRRSGLLGVILILPMIASGYLLQTVTNEALHAFLVFSHVTAGCGFAIAYTLHLLLAPKKPVPNGGGVPNGRLRESNRAPSVR